MSTRCQIGFYEKGEKDLSKFKALIYRHCDGYPEDKGGVVATVVPILEDFNKNRGLDDIEYASAWLVAKLKDDYTNIGICKNFHGDIEYFYAVYPSRLDVYETPFDSSWENWERIEMISLDGEA
jgi:hypothetical protein